MGDVAGRSVGQSPEERKEAADTVRKEFVAQIAGASLRAEQLPRNLLKVLPFAAANQMLVLIVNGKLKPKTASEAIQVAKLAVDIGRAEVGEAASDQPKTKAERDVLHAEAKGLLDAIRQRRGVLELEADGTPGAITADEPGESATDTGS